MSQTVRDQWRRRSRLGVATIATLGLTTTAFVPAASGSTVLQEDLEPPVFEGSLVEPTRHNLSPGDLDVTVTVAISDASELEDLPQVEIRHSEVEDQVYGPVDMVRLGAGDDVPDDFPEVPEDADIYQRTLTVLHGAAAGDWDVTILPVTDVHANETTDGHDAGTLEIYYDTEVTPAAPTFNDEPGTEDDTVTIPTSEGVQYLIGDDEVEAGTYDATGTVTVTAEPLEDYAFTDDAQTQWTHEFTDVTPVTPEAPVFTDESGTENDTITIPDTTGVRYLVDGEVVEAGTIAGEGEVTVTAEALDGYVIADDAQTEWEHSFDARVEVVPTAPTFTDEPGRIDDSVTIPETTGVEYLIGEEVVEAGEHEASGEVVVTARATEGYVIAEGADTSWTHTFDATFPPQRYGFFLNDGWDGEADHVFQYGRHNDEVLVGDWDGDGTDSIMVRRGERFFVNNAPRGGPAEYVFAYGRAGDEVFVGDWDGDGRDTLAVRRGNTYFVKNSLTNGAADHEFDYGRVGDDVYVGNWDGEGSDTFAVRRGATYYVKNDLENGNADHEFAYGRAADVTLVGDWDNDGRDTLAVRRGNTYYVKNDLGSGPADFTQTYGRAGDHVYVGDWNGDGYDTLGVRRVP